MHLPEKDYQLVITHLQIIHLERNIRTFVWLLIQL